MNVRKALVLNFGALAISTLPSFAGPCSQQIDDTLVQIDRSLNARAQAGPTANETLEALQHRQPTPKSMADAEVRLGDVSPKTVQTVREAMARARKADLAGDAADCEKALAEARRALNN